MEDFLRYIKNKKFKLVIFFLDFHPEKICIRIENSYFLRGNPEKGNPYGVGITYEEALENYIKKIKGKTLVTYVHRSAVIEEDLDHKVPGNFELAS